MKIIFTDKVEKRKKKLEKKKKKKEKEEDRKKVKEILKAKDPAIANPPPLPSETEPLKELSMIDKIDNISEKLDGLSKHKEDKVKKKMLKVPSKVKRQLKKLAMKNKIIVEILRENRSSDMIVTPIINGYIYVDGVPHNCSNDFIYLSKGKYPKIYLPEWDLNPIGTKDYYNAQKEGRSAYPYATIIRMLQDKDVLKKAGMETKYWAWIIIGGIVAAYLLLGS